MTLATPSVGFSVHPCEPDPHEATGARAGGLSGRRSVAPTAGSDAKRRGQHADAFEHVADAAPVDQGRGEEHEVLRTEEEWNG